MPYDKKKTFEAAENRAALSTLKATQNIKPDKRNYYSTDWVNGRYPSYDAAKAAYDKALKAFHVKDRDKKKTPSEQAKELLRIRKENRKSLGLYDQDI